jgi:hypothetical protein
MSSKSGHRWLLKHLIHLILAAIDDNFRWIRCIRDSTVQEITIRFTSRTQQLKCNPLNITSPGKGRIMATLMERMAGKSYRIKYDPAAKYQEGGEKGSLRSMYQYIPCKYGEIYEYDDGILAWHCTSVRLSNKIVRELHDWMEVQVEFDDGTVFLNLGDRMHGVAYRFKRTSELDIDPVTRDLV